MMQAATSSSLRGDRAGPAATHRMPYKQWGDGALASAVVLHDEDAYTEICRRHSTALRAASAMILGRNPVCDDVVADVLMAFWAGPESFDPGRGPLLGYLRLKARGRSIDVLRSESRRQRREECEARSTRHSISDIDAGFLAEEAGAELNRALALLHENEREPIRLAFYHAMSYQAVAGYLKIPEGTAKSRIRSGLRRLRAAMQAADCGDTMAVVADQPRSPFTGNPTMTRRK